MNATDLLFELTTRYTEAHRRYHDLRHIADMLCKGASLDLNEEQRMAIWFHDAVYEPGSKDNEEDSADLAVQKLIAAGWPVDRAQVVAEIIRDTKGHQPSIEESKKVLDLDLSTLGGSWEEYQRNGANIRAEFANLSDAEWNAGRSDWLRAMLGRERLFWTEWGTPLEKQARENLQRDLDQLNGS